MYQWLLMQWFIRLVSGTANASDETVRSLGNILSGLVAFFKKRRAYDLVKTTFRFRLGLRRLHAAYDLVKTRLSESEPEAGKN